MEKPSALGPCHQLSMPPRLTYLISRILIDAVFRALAAEPALLHAAEGGDIGGDHAVIDADQPDLEGLGDAEDAAEVAGVEVARKPDIAVIGESLMTSSSSRT